MTNIKIINVAKRSQNTKHSPKQNNKIVYFVKKIKSKQNFTKRLATNKPKVSVKITSNLNKVSQSLALHKAKRVQSRPK